VLGALAPPTLDDALVTTLSEVGIVLLLFHARARVQRARARLRAAEPRAGDIAPGFRCFNVELEADDEVSSDYPRTASSVMSRRV
jgi:hypothetical protein